ncbi:uncharacterized protein si:dkey-22n8.3 isoform X2 [Morone saxatilis]|uniref:uncharacterized protein si:dkey-22n8.3 isoform X2 n=1 Tax=Morone saxatilis TaxID=34816 RepID=UPI0015E23D53|nr:uncharacterized protein si:dkey-22n8.3 isoform X2 [Morone saxatilis]
MAAALFRGGTGVCVRCIHRELCRVVWRPQTALFSSKPPDRNQPRRTHIKKAKPQPAVDVAKLLEQLFSQRRPGTAPPAAKARPAKASSVPTKPPTTSSIKVSTSNIPSLSVVPAASSFQQIDSVPKTTNTFNTAPLSPQPIAASSTNPKTSYSSDMPPQSPLDFIQGFAADSVSNVTFSLASTAPASLEPEAAAIGWQTSAETIENVETATEPVELKTVTVLPLSAHTVEENVETSSFSAVTVETLIETTTESTVELGLSPVETLDAAVVESPVEPTVDVPVEVQTKCTDSGMIDVSYTAKLEPFIGTTIESPADPSQVPVETLETRAAVVDGPVESTIDVTLDITAETKSTNSGVVDITHNITVEPLLEITAEPSVDASTSPLETLETRAAVVECPVDAPAQAVQTNSTDSGHVNFSHIADEEPLKEATIDPSVEASTPPLETLESRAAVAEGSVETLTETEADTAAQAVQTSTKGRVSVSYSAKEEPLIETVEPAVEASTSPLESRAAVSEGTIEPTVETEAAVSPSHSALIQNAQESAPLPLRNKAESTVESSLGNFTVEEGVKSEQMTLESVTLHAVTVQVESLKTDELLQTKSALDEKAEKQLQELLVQTGTGAEYKAAAETENASEDEAEILTKALSKWNSLSEDLQELEGESGTLVKELLCHVPAVLSKTPDMEKTISASGPPVGANGECLQVEEKGSEAEAMTLESVIFLKVKAEVGGLETEVLLETRNALEKEAEVLAKEERMEIRKTMEDVFEDTTEAEILTLDSISETTDAIEAETSVMLETMFGSEQGPTQPSVNLPVDQQLGQQDETSDQEKRSGEQEESALEAMTLEYVILADIEVSLETLENESLSEASDYLEKEAEILAGEKRMEVEDVVASEETTEALSFPEDDAPSTALQADTLMEEPLFSVSEHITGVTEGQIGQEVVRENILDAVATGSVDIDLAATVTEDLPASDALKEVLLGEEVEEEGVQTEALGIADGTQTALDPVQRLFLEKIREYNNMSRLNGGPLEAEPDYEKYLSEETAKLQRLYGGGDLSSFPEFTFTEPKMDQDSK